MSGLYTLSATYLTYVVFPLVIRLIFPGASGAWHVRMGTDGGGESVFPSFSSLSSGLLETCGAEAVEAYGRDAVEKYPGSHGYRAEYSVSLDESQTGLLHEKNRWDICGSVSGESSFCNGDRYGLQLASDYFLGTRILYQQKGI